MTLHGEQDHVAGLPFDKGGVADRGDPERVEPIRRFQLEPAGLDPAEMGAPGDQRHVMTGLPQTTAHHTADGPGAQHDIAHLHPRMSNFPVGMICLSGGHDLCFRRDTGPVPEPVGRVSRRGRSFPG